eukprot:scaffold188715_cov18-Prasinocladus_malaysianus.AAC.1
MLIESAYSSLATYVERMHARLSTDRCIGSLPLNYQPGDQPSNMEGRQQKSTLTKTAGAASWSWSQLAGGKLNWAWTRGQMLQE